MVRRLASAISSDADEATNTLGIAGMGAYVGLAKAVNGSELLSLADAVAICGLQRVPGTSMAALTYR